MNSSDRPQTGLCSLIAQKLLQTVLVSTGADAGTVDAACGYPSDISRAVSGVASDLVSRQALLRLAIRALAFMETCKIRIVFVPCWQIPFRCYVPSLLTSRHGRQQGLFLRNLFIPRFAMHTGTDRLAARAISGMEALPCYCG